MCATGECRDCSILADLETTPALSFDLRVPALRPAPGPNMTKLFAPLARAEKVMLRRALEPRPFEDAIAAGLRMGVLLQAVMRRTRVRLSCLGLTP